MNRLDLPAPPEGTAWSLRRRADVVSLRLRTRGLRGRTLASWRTENFSALDPDPEAALRHVASQIAATAGAVALVKAA